MVEIHGKSVYRGTAFGPVKKFLKEKSPVTRRKIGDLHAEKARLHTACEETEKQLQQLYEKALREVGENSAAIFEVHQMLLQDPDYQEAIVNMIEKEGVNAEYAVATIGDHFSAMFAEMEDAYMKERAADIRDISGRLIGCLQGKREAKEELQEKVILLAEDLSPSETVQIDKNRVLAFVTVHGSTNSHTAILARTMNIPALVRAEMNLEQIADGTPAIVDGNTGMLILNPTEEQRQKALKKIENEKEQEQLLQELKGKESKTASGRKILVYANIGNIGDVGHVLENDAEGIGLFRSEFLYLGRDSFPSEEEQFRVYRQVLQMMAGRRVIIRTLDIGADKQADYFGMEPEENPALGLRAIRICLKRPEIFKTQLRALLRAAVFGNLSIMYPMITSLWEVQKIREMVQEVQQELERQGIPMAVPEQGIMVETPAAALICENLAEHVDFFSIGTNDLIQYTLAADRQNENLEEFCQTNHPAVLKLIQMVIDGAHRHKKWVGICGELAADTSLTETFVQMGIDELSVSPSMVLKVRKVIREVR